VATIDYSASIIIDRSASGKSWPAGIADKSVRDAEGKS
jgi:hypothetical protein